VPPSTKSTHNALTEPDRTEPATQIDGRIARGLRARKSMADALISLLQEGIAAPTAREIASRAGVSLRLVFHHFEDMEEVFKAAVAIQVERHWKSLQPVAALGPLQKRVHDTVTKRLDLYESVAPVRRAAARRIDSSPIITEHMDASRELLRAHLLNTFATELARDPKVSTLDALEVALSFETWDLLQRDLRTTDRTGPVMEHLALGALGTQKKG
jgi:TetR/AcrR family transcriptional regulator, regulator of autoinduction and epiphytic fitness